MCNAEAPAVEQFARQYADQVRVVGMGTQDGFELAEDFVARNGTTTPLMTWDETFATWEHYGVRGQPWLILLDRLGEPLGAWPSLDDELVGLIEGSA